MISSALSSDSDDVTKLLNVSLDLITASNAPNSTNKKQKKDENTGSTAKHNPKLKLGMDGLKGASAIADSERAVEVLSFLVSKTKVRCKGNSKSPITEVTHYNLFCDTSRICKACRRGRAHFSLNDEAQILLPAFFRETGKPPSCSVTPQRAGDQEI